MNPTSWMPVIAQSRAQPEKAVFSFLGSAWVYGCRTKYRAYAAAYGVTSNCSSEHTPASAHPVTLRTVFPHASLVVSPTSPSTRITSAASSSLTWWNWMFSRVVTCPLFNGTNLAETSPSASNWSAFSPPNGILIRIICASGWRWP